MSAGLPRIGSLATITPMLEDASVLVIIDATINLVPLARLGRRFKGTEVRHRSIAIRTQYAPVETYRP
jgi:hypothetical protein